MFPAKHVSQIGAVAFSLGVGLFVATGGGCGVASAAPSSPGDSSSGSSSNGSAGAATSSPRSSTSQNTSASSNALKPGSSSSQSAPDTSPPVGTTRNSAAPQSVSSPTSTTRSRVTTELSTFSSATPTASTATQNRQVTATAVRQPAPSATAPSPKLAVTQPGTSTPTAVAVAPSGSAGPTSLPAAAATGASTANSAGVVTRLEAIFDRDSPSTQDLPSSPVSPAVMMGALDLVRREVDPTVDENRLPDQDPYEAFETTSDSPFKALSPGGTAASNPLAPTFVPGVSAGISYSRVSRYGGFRRPPPLFRTPLPEPPPIGQREFTVTNATSGQIRLDNYGYKPHYLKQATPQGTVLNPGESAHFTVQGNGRISPEFRALTSGATYKAYLNVNGLTLAYAACKGNCTPTTANIGYSLPSHTVTLLETARTVTVSDQNQQAQADILNRVCANGGAHCSFVSNGKPPIETFSNPILAAQPIKNNTLDTIKKTVAAKVLYSNTSSVEISSKVFVGIKEVVTKEITAKYGRSWTNSYEATESYEATVRPGQTLTVYSRTPVLRYYGDLIVKLGNTTWDLKNVYFDYRDTREGKFSEINAVSTPNKSA